MKIITDKFLENAAQILGGALGFILTDKVTIAMDLDLITPDNLHSPIALGINLFGALIGVALINDYVHSTPNHEKHSLKEMEKSDESFDFFKSNKPKMR